MKVKEKVLKNIILVVLMIISILVLQNSVYAETVVSEGGNELEIDMSIQGTPKMKKDETVYVDVNVKGEVSTFEGYFTFDDEYFEIIGIQSNPNLQGSWTAFYNKAPGSPADNRVTNYENSGTAYDPNGLFFTIEMKFLKDSDVSQEIEMQDIYLTDKDFEEGYVESISAEMKVMYDVTFSSNTTATVTDMPENTVKVQGEDLTLPGAPTRAGYTFENWNTQADGKGTSYAAEATYSTDAAADFYAQWSANTNTAYKVEHYKQNTDGTYPDTATETENLTGTTDTEVQATVKQYAGYLEDETNEDRLVSGSIAGDGSLVLKVYYKLELKVTYKPGTKGTFEEQVHNANANEATPAFEGEKTGADGYSFTGWSPEVAETVTESADYVAQWSANTDTPYTVKHYKQNTDGTYPDTATGTENCTGTTDTTAQAVAMTFDGYVEDTENQNRVVSGNIAGDGSLVLKVYYKIQYKVTYKPGTKGTFEDQEYTLDVNAVTPAFEGDITGAAGYTFAGWSPEVAGTATQNVDYVAQWTANTNTPYKVEHYKQNTDGTYPATATYTENCTGTTDTTANAIALTYEGYVEDIENENRIVSGNIAGDGSLVLKVYYAEVSDNTNIEYVKVENTDLTEDEQGNYYMEVEKKYSEEIYSIEVKTEDSDATITMSVRNDEEYSDVSTISKNLEITEDVLNIKITITAKNGKTTAEHILTIDKELYFGTTEYRMTPAVYYDKSLKADKFTEEEFKRYKENDLYLMGMFPKLGREEVGTTIALLKEKLIVNSNATIKVFKNDEEITGDTTLVGTGMVVKAIKGEKEITLTAVVRGDVNGDGKMSGADNSIINDYVATLSKTHIDSVAKEMAIDVDLQKGYATNDAPKFRKVYQTNDFSLFLPTTK